MNRASGIYILLPSLTLSGPLGGGHWEWEKAKMGQVALAPASTHPCPRRAASGEGSVRAWVRAGGRTGMALKCHWVGAA